MKTSINQLLTCGLDSFQMESLQSADTVQNLLSIVNFSLGSWLEDM